MAARSSPPDPAGPSSAASRSPYSWPPGRPIAGVFAPRTPDDWTQHGLIVSKDTGQAYVILPDADGEVDGESGIELRPVINITSASLILGPDVEPMLISQDTIDEQRIGDDVGILGAPASVPTSSLLIDSGWTACTADQRGIRVQVSDTPDVMPAPNAGITVVNDGQYFVVVQSDPAGPGEGGSYVFPVPQQKAPGIDQTDNLLSQLQLQPTNVAVQVPREWINLFPVGAPLDFDSFRLEGFGESPDDVLPGDAADAVVGDLLETEDGEYLLVTQSGPVELEDFAARVYLNVVLPNDELVEPIEVESAPSVGRGDSTALSEARWPLALPDPLGSEPCAQLTAGQGEAPVAQLVSPGDAAAVGTLTAEEKDQIVDPGRGAYVLSGGWSGVATGASPYLIDAKGRANPLVGPETAAQLGYADVAVPVVPDTWIELFRCGVNLSEDAALQPPTDASEPACE